MQPVVFLKNQADIAVLRRKTKIQCAKDFYNFCTDNLQNPKSGMYNCRIFKYIETIPRNELVNYKTVAENRKIHQIVSKGNSPGKLVTSHLSCYECELCLNGNNQNCTNRKFIGDYKLMQMKVMNSETIERSETDTDEIHENISNLINIGSVVAVLADDPDYEFYLMKVNRKPFVLKKEGRDVWGGTFPAGAEVVEGFYYDRCENNPFLYKLIPKKTAFVYAMAVRYICVELNPCKTVAIPEHLHLDIVKSLE